LTQSSFCHPRAAMSRPALAAFALILAACAQAGTAEDLNALASDDECDADTGQGGCGLAALQLRGAPTSGSVPEEELLEAVPTTTCKKALSQIDGSKNWEISFWSMNMNVKDSDDIDAKEVSYRSDAQALRIFMNHDTRNIQISNLHKDNACTDGKNVLWFYPIDDPNGAFDLNDFVCSRLSVATQVSGADCLNLYRVKNVQQMSMIFDRFVWDNTVIHAVIGGHGSNDQSGVLSLGAGDDDDVAQDKQTKKMLGQLRTALTSGATIFLDSCYSARNGLAKFVSQQIPDAWVMGGIVSLDGSIDMLPGKNGPARILSDFPSADDDVPEFKDGTQAIKVFRHGKDMGLASGFGAPAKDPNP